ncbi:hypothetical protein [Xenorhabdus griffiniae]|uniref:hypothetical protein n=1 Tax=Xenorhabdus griffiniae TaxID=351672 RepID=UPI00235A1B56|nr:hypothetical protein [Xenorhabdus griffiniae]MDC9607225.1 hypothetical protein [Xenorhabdus griffiniae]
MPEDSKAAKEGTCLVGRWRSVPIRRGVCQEGAPMLTAEGEALCATPRDAEQRGRQT